MPKATAVVICTTCENERVSVSRYTLSIWSIRHLYSCQWWRVTFNNASDYQANRLL